MKYEEIENFIKTFKGYENKTGVYPIEIKEVIKDKDISIWIKKSSNGQTGFFIVYECAVGSNNWLFWCPSENQIRFMENKLTPLYNDMEKLREEIKNNDI